MEPELPAVFWRDLGDRRVAQAVCVALSRSLAARRHRGPSLDRQVLVCLVGRAIGHRTTDCLRFWQLAPVSLAANLVVAPLLAVVLRLGVLAALTGWILPWVAMLFNEANYLVIMTLLELVELLAALPFVAVEVPRPGRLSRLLCDTLLAWAAIAR